MVTAIEDLTVLRLKAKLVKMLEESRQQIYGFNSEVAASYHDGKECMLEVVIDMIDSEVSREQSI